MASKLRSTLVSFAGLRCMPRCPLIEPPGLDRTVAWEQAQVGVPTGRTKRRIAKKVEVELARPSVPKSQETAAVENVSERGMRVVTEHVWRPGDLVVLSSPRTGFRTQARVVYCYRIESKGFAMGLELSTPLGDLARPQ